MGEYRGTHGFVSAKDDRGGEVLAQGNNTLKLHGAAADVVYGSQTAARLRKWAIRQRDGKWTLSATVEKSDAFLCNQRGLLFTAARDRFGNWAWGIEKLQLAGNQLKALLGKPEQ